MARAEKFVLIQQTLLTCVLRVRREAATPYYSGATYVALFLLAAALGLARVFRSLRGSCRNGFATHWQGRQLGPAQLPLLQRVRVSERALRLGPRAGADTDV